MRSTRGEPDPSPGNGNASIGGRTAVQPDFARIADRSGRSEIRIGEGFGSCGVALPHSSRRENGPGKGQENTLPRAAGERRRRSQDEISRAIRGGGVGSLLGLR